MTRLLGVLVVAVAIVMVPAVVNSQSEKTVNATGAVTAVVPDSLSVKGKAGAWTFTIDKETTVVARGATHKSLELKAEGKSTKLTDFVKVGDEVTVSYHDRGATKHAATIRVTQQVK